MFILKISDRILKIIKGHLRKFSKIEKGLGISMKKKWIITCSAIVLCIAIFLLWWECFYAQFRPNKATIVMNPFELLPHYEEMSVTQTDYLPVEKDIYIFANCMENILSLDVDIKTYYSESKEDYLIFVYITGDTDSFSEMKEQPIIRVLSGPETYSVDSENTAELWIESDGQMWTYAKDLNVRSYPPNGMNVWTSEFKPYKGRFMILASYHAAPTDNTEFDKFYYSVNITQ